MNRPEPTLFDHKPADVWAFVERLFELTGDNIPLRRTIEVDWFVVADDFETIMGIVPARLVTPIFSPESPSVYMYGASWEFEERTSVDLIRFRENGAVFELYEDDQGRRQIPTPLGTFIGNAQIKDHYWLSWTLRFPYAAQRRFKKKLGLPDATP